MALITEFDTEIISTGNVRVTWTGTAGKGAWIFIDGLLRVGPVFFSGTSRSYDLNWNAEDIRALAIWEDDFNTVVVSPQREPELNPTIVWTFVPGADFYRVYHREGLTGDEGLIETVAVVPGKRIYYHRISNAVNGENGVWNFFRVVSVKNGKESTQTLWPHHVKGIPGRVGITLSEGDGKAYLDWPA